MLLQVGLFLSLILTRVQTAHNIFDYGAINDIEDVDTAFINSRAFVSATLAAN